MWDYRGERKESVSPVQRAWLSESMKKKKKLNKGVESNPGFSTRFHLHYPVDLWLASAKANLDQSSWLGWRRNCIEGYVPYFHQIPFFIFFP